MSQPVMSGGKATIIQARWAARRMLRGRTIWVAWIFALLPVVYALVVAKAGHALGWATLFESQVLLAGVLGPLFMASSVSEEIEDRTFTYLWSRPLPRWSVIIGKLAASAPLAGGILALSVALCFLFTEGGTNADLVRSVAAALAGTMVTCALSAGLATLVPRAGLTVTFGYLLALDAPVGLIPFSLRNLSVTHQIREIAGIGSGAPPWGALAWLLGLGAFWLALGLWRLSRAEFTSGDK